MRILAASTHGAGHFAPLVPFLDAVLRQDDEVVGRPADPRSTRVPVPPSETITRFREVARGVREEMRRQRPIDELLEAALD